MEIIKMKNKRNPRIVSVKEAIKQYSGAVGIDAEVHGKLDIVKVS